MLATLSSTVYSSHAFRQNVTRYIEHIDAKKKNASEIFFVGMVQPFEQFP